MSAWQGFLHESDIAMRRNEMSRGLSYTPSTSDLTIDVVADYMDGFGAPGVGAREVTNAVGRDERGVKRALATLVDSGVLWVEETPTRGPKASKRKVYRPTQNKGPTTVSLGEHFDYYGSPADGAEYGAGGGRAVSAHLVPYNGEGNSGNL